MVPSLLAPHDKPTQRVALRAARAGFARNGPLVVPDAFRRRLSRGLTVASYAPIGSEADPAPFARAATEAGCVIALPHVVDRKAPLRFLRFESGDVLVPGPFGLSQPRQDAQAVQPDIILTPLLGFDRRGTRLGQGAGHYDRAFAALPQAWRVGIAWSVQAVETLVADPWDMPLHAIATELDWIEP